jgi:23S rRNA pseudouridine1911/1915/1917 synthase
MEKHIYIVPEKEKNVPLGSFLLKELAEYVVLSKPSRMLVHPTSAKESGTLVQQLLEAYPEIKDVGDSIDRPGIVHRLDKSASGVMVVARTQAMFGHLKKQFQDRLVDKEYTALVHGVVERDAGKIDFLIERGSAGRMAARPYVDTTKLKNVGKEQTGREALTEFWVEKRYARFTQLKVKIHTGRTHQIRVHMMAYGHPIVGDSLYFNKKLNRKRDKELNRLFLHASKLCFEDLGGIRQCYESPLPSELGAFLEKLN